MSLASEKAMAANPVAYAEAYPAPPGQTHSVSYHAFPVDSNPSSSAPTLTPVPINEAGAREFLSSQNWPSGLQDTFVKNLHKLPMRFFICDDSGSMVANDGHKLVEANGQKK